MALNVLHFSSPTQYVEGYGYLKFTRNDITALLCIVEASVTLCRFRTEP